MPGIPYLGQWLWWIFDFYHHHTVHQLQLTSLTYFKRGRHQNKIGTEQMNPITSGNSAILYFWPSSFQYNLTYTIWYYITQTYVNIQSVFSAILHKQTRPILSRIFQQNAYDVVNTPFTSNKAPGIQVDRIRYYTLHCIIFQPVSQTIFKAAFTLSSVKCLCCTFLSCPYKKSMHPLFTYFSFD